MTRHCRRCRLPLASPGTAVCLHVRVSVADLGQALRGAIALECALRAARSRTESKEH